MNEPLSLSANQPWWAMFVTDEGQYHIAPWSDAENRIANDHVVGDCWCGPDTDFLMGYGTVLLHRDPQWPNSAETVN